ncbi:MAG TPA: ABC transporter ATP-binding protein [Sediminibacterium sp.]|nr:ABC transporter ATP-binding protein [Sediminibacterium sp.]
MSATLLQINDLCISFQGPEGLRPALQHIYIQVNKGETVAIVGESGSGKSITSLSILGLLASPPAQYTQGSILFTQGNRTADLLRASRETMEALRGNKIAMIFQEPMTSLNPVLTCGFQVMEAISTHLKLDPAAAKARTLALFEKVQLPDPAGIFNRYPHQISGGQKQRVMIAMAISCEPELLICDEPTTALDVTVQKNILQLIRSLQKEQQMGVIFITHDLGVVAEVADRVVVLYKGQLVEENTTLNLFRHPQHPYTRALLACRPVLHTKGERLPVVSDFMQGEGNGVASVQTKADRQTVTNANPASVANRLFQPDNGLGPLVTVRNLQVHFPTKKSFFGKPLACTRAVDDVSFDIYPGETLGLVGESGCGKSTLGRTLLQLIPATGGQVMYKGMDLTKADAPTLKKLRREMQIIFQDPYSSLNPRMRIGEAIAEPLLVHQLVRDKKEAREKVMHLLEKVNLLPEHYQRYPHEFSGGQRQRIVIARALALNPSFIICDESVSALDVSVQAQVLNLLNDLKADFGFTAVFISHDLSVVRYISDRIIVMQKGRIIESGEASSVYYHPKEAYTQQLIAAIPKGIIA